MGKYDELKKLAEAAAGNWEDSLLHEYSECEFYIENASPAVVLYLIAENERLSKEHDKQWSLAQSGIHNTEVVLAENAKLRADSEALRQIISDSATACGAAMSPECTVEFMGHLPAEIAGVLRLLRAELERARASLREVSAIVDGNIREIIRDLVNRDAGLNNGANPNDIYAECDRIDTEIDAAMGKGGRADG